jgi:uncharacterized protein (DUF779 family)
MPTDLTIGPDDVKQGDVGGVPFYISKSQNEQLFQAHAPRTVKPQCHN